MPTYYSNIIAKRLKNNSKHILLCLLSISILSSCNDFFEKNIEAESPTLIIPTDNDTIYSNKVHFKWEEMKGATFYNLQIVKPSFDDIDLFVLDSNINAEEFYFILNPGDYEFKFRAENSAHKSMSIGPYAIYVDSISDLADQFVSLVSPADNIYVNGIDNINLSWLNLFAADKYEYILKIGANFETGSIVDQNLSISTLSYIVSSSFFEVEGTYFWGIRGVNVSGGSPYTYRQINVDLTQPNNPVLISPIDEVFSPIIDPVVLKWTTGVDPGTVHSPVVSAVEISATESFIDYIEFGGIIDDSLEYTFPSIGDYWWRVKADDQAGNFSELYSPERKITIE